MQSAVSGDYLSPFDRRAWMGERRGNPGLLAARFDRHLPRRMTVGISRARTADGPLPDEDAFCAELRGGRCVPEPGSMATLSQKSSMPRMARVNSVRSTGFTT